jgi:hypothetical protein
MSGVNEMNKRFKKITRAWIAVMTVIVFTFFGIIPPCWAADYTPVSNTAGTAVDPGVWTAYDNIYIANGVTFYLKAGTHDLTAANLIVQSGGTIVCLPSSTTVADSTGVVITTTGNITVEAGGNISADGKGYAGGTSTGNGYGPGAGKYVYWGGSGAGYGGRGGNSYDGNQQGGGTYPMGSTGREPVLLGSGGGPGNAAGGAGGGAIKLITTGTLTNSGTISANGATGGAYAGGGSGGSLWIVANNLAGTETGIFSAKGGNGGTGTAGYGPSGGGAGRIHISPSLADSYNGSIIVAGGVGDGQGGEVGTIVRDPAAMLPDITIAGVESSLTGTTMTFTNGSTAVVGSGTLFTTELNLDDSVLGNDGLWYRVRTITDNTHLNLDSVYAGTTGSPASKQKKRAVIWTRGDFILNSLTIGANAMLTTGIAMCGSGINDGLGEGPGKKGSYGGGGGGHASAGGRGYDAAGVGGIAYGNADAPVSFGSSGGGTAVASGWSGHGGGALKLTLDTLTLNGTLSVDGGNAKPTGIANGMGGGSGGSLWIIANDLLGTGKFSAKGGNASGGANGGGGGSGGRLALYYATTKDGTLATDVTGGAKATGGVGDGGVGSTVAARGLAANLKQYQRDGTTEIAPNGNATSFYVAFKFLMSTDVESATLTPQVEMKPLGTAFDETGITEGSSVAYDGTTAVTGIVTYFPLELVDESTRKGYHWRARIKDASNNYSSWVSYSNNAETAADLQGPLGTKITTNTTWITDQTVTNLYIAPSVIVTANSVGKTGGAGQIVLTANNLFMDTGSKIIADGTGHLGGIKSGFTQANINGQAPPTTSGGGTWQYWGGSGGAHASSGGASSGGAGGTAYDTNGLQLTNPTDLGSGGGGASSNPGGAGGGSFKLNISDVLINYGTLSANGIKGDSVSASGAAGGGGSGGSIWILASKFVNTGPVEAKGGSTRGVQWNGFAGGGSGGRISCAVTSFESSGSYSVNGGACPSELYCTNTNSNGGAGSLNGVGAFITAITSPANNSYFKQSFTIQGGATSPASTLIKVQLLIQNTTNNTYWSGSNWSGTSSSWVDATGTTSWSYASPTLNSGDAYLLQGRANDGLVDPGVTYSQAVFYYDTSAPTVSAGANQVKKEQFEQTATASDASPMTYQWTKQAGSGTVTFGSPEAKTTTISADTEGEYTLRFTATDAATNSAYSDMTLMWDTTPPSAPTPRTIVSTNDVPTLAKTGETVTVTATVEANSTLAGTVDGKAATGNVVGTTGTLSRVLDGTENEGALVFSFVLTDQAGNPGSANTTTTDGSSVTFDITEPEAPTPITITSSNAVPTLAKTGNTVTLTATVEANSTLAGTIDGKAATGNVVGTTGTLSRVLDGTENEGALTFSFVSTDQAGNAGSANTATTDESSVTFDKTLPTITTITSTATAAGILKIGDTIVFTLTPGATEAGASVSGSYNGSELSWSTANDGETYTSTYTVEEGDPDQTSALQISDVVITDVAGNASAAGSGSDVVKTIDGNTPTITTITSTATAAGILKIGDTIVFTLTPGATEAGASVVGSYNGSELSWSTANDGVTYTATYTVEEGNPDQTSALQISDVVITDAAGNASVAGSGSDVVKTIDANTPTGSITEVSPSSGTKKVGDTITLTVTAGSDETGLTLAGTINGKSGTNVQALGGADAGKYTIDYVIAEGDANVAEGALAVSLTLTDAANNESAAITAVPENTVVIDANKPTITTITSTATAEGILKIGDTIVFTLTPGATEAGASVVGSYNGSELSWSTANDGVTYTATYTVEEGNPDQTSALQISDVVITDAAGNASVAGSGSDVVKTIDANTPAAPMISSIAGNNLINDSEKAAIIVVGTAEEDSTVDVSLSDEGSAHTVTGSGTAIGGSYSISIDGTTLNDGTISPSVTATDAAGNVSDATVTPSATKDVSAPLAPETPTAEDGPNINNAEKLAGFPVVVGLDTSGAVTGDTLELFLDGGAFPTPLSHVLTADEITAGSYFFTIISSQLGSDGEKLITARVTDIVGNPGTVSPALTLTLDTGLPAAPTAVGFTPVGGTVVTNTLNNTNTNFIATATITAASATGGTAELLKDGASFSAPVLDSDIGAEDTSVSFDAGLTDTEEVQTAFASSATVSVKITDVAGNSNTSSVDNPAITVDYISPTASAPVNTAQRLKEGDVSTSSVQSTEAGNIYLVKTGTAAGTQAEIDDAVTAHDAFLAQESAEADTAYTATLAVDLIDGVYDIVAVDNAGNVSDAAAGWLTVDNTDPVASAPINIAQNLKGGDVSTSTVQSNEAGNIYLVKHGTVAGSQSEIDSAVTAHNAFLGKENASADTAYTVTLAEDLNDGVYDIVAVDVAGNVSAAADGWLLTDNTAPAAPNGVAFTATGGNVVTNTLNNTNTNFTASATIPAGEATSGTAELLKDGASFTTPILDSSIAADDTEVSFDAGLTTNEEVQAAFANGATLSVRLADVAGNYTDSTVANPSIITDYVSPDAPAAATIVSGSGWTTDHISSANVSAVKVSGNKSTDTITIKIAIDDEDTFTSPATRTLSSLGDETTYADAAGIDTSDLEDGTIALRITAYDTAGNSSAQTVLKETASFNKDALIEPPTSTIVAGAGWNADYISASNAAAVKVSGGKSSDTITVKIEIDDEDTFTDAVTTTLTGLNTATTYADATGIDASLLTDGTIAMRVTSWDEAGNSAVQTVLKTAGTYKKDVVIPTTGVSGESVHPTGDTIALSFSEPMDLTTITDAILRANANVTLDFSDNAGNLNQSNVTVTNATTAWSDGNTVATITLNEATDSAYIPNGKYVGVTYNTLAVRDLAGNGVVSDEYYSESVGKESFAPALAVTAQYVAAGNDIVTIISNEVMTAAAATLSNWSLYYDDDNITGGETLVPTTNAQISFDSSKKIVTITVNETADGAILPNQKYIKAVAHPTNIKDLVGNNSVAAAWTVEPFGGDTVAPTMTVAATSVHAAGDTITLTFNEAIDTTTLTTANLTSRLEIDISDNAGGLNQEDVVLTNATVAWNVAKTVATITLNETVDGTYIPNAKYVGVTPVSNMIKDLSGNAVAPTEIFTPGPVMKESTAPVFSSVSPAASSSVSNARVTYTLSELCASGTITWIRTGGLEDPDSPHAQALTASELTAGAHSNITLTNDPTLVNGAIYTVTFEASDLVGNVGTPVTHENVAYDAEPPFVESVSIASNNDTTTLAKAGNTVTLTIRYSEPVTASLLSASTAFNLAASATKEVNASDADTDTIVFPVTSGDSGVVTPNNINFRITDASGLSTTITSLGDIAGSVTVDTVLPTVNVTVSPDPASNLSTGELMIALVFSESMKTDVSPVVTYDPVGAVGAQSCTGGTWSTTTNPNDTYIVYNDNAITGSTGDGDAVISVSAAQDLASNAMLTDTSKTFTINTTMLEITGLSDPVTAGVASNITVNIKSMDGQLRPNYTGTVTFSSDDVQAVLPANYTFTAEDGGTHTFTAGVMLKTSGSKTVTVTDTVSASITDSATVTVNPGPTAKYALTAPADIVAGTRAAYTVTRYDAYDNLAVDGTERIYLTTNSESSAAAFKNAAQGGSTITSVQLIGGVSSGNFWYYDTLVGNWTICASDAVPADGTDGIDDATDALSVTPATANKFALISETTSMTAGDTASVTITAYDVFSNVATAYGGASPGQEKTLTFSGANSSISPVTAPTATNNVGTPVAFGGETICTFINGVSSSSLRLYKAEGVAIKVTDDSFPAKTTADIDDLEIIVSGGTASALSWYMPPESKVVANSAWKAFAVSVTDTYGNVSPSEATITVTPSIGMTLKSGSTNAVAASSGVATFNNFAVYSSNGTYPSIVTLTASTGAVSSSASNTVTVSEKYSVTLNVKDSVTLGGLSDVSLTITNSDTGATVTVPTHESPWTANSPFQDNFVLPAGNYTLSLEKDEYVAMTMDVAADTTQDGADSTYDNNLTWDIYMTSIAESMADYKVIADFMYDEVNDVLNITQRLERRGQQKTSDAVNALGAATIEIYDGADKIGVLMAAADVQGNYWYAITGATAAAPTGSYVSVPFTKAFASGKTYFARCNVSYGGVGGDRTTYTSGTTFLITVSERMSEEIINKIGMLGEGETLASRIAAVQTGVTAISGKVNTVDTKIDTVGTKIDTIGTQVTAVNANVSSIGTKVDTVQGAVGAIQTDVSTTLPAQILADLEKGVMSEMLTRNTVLREDDAVKIRYRTASGLAPVLTIYDPDGNILSNYNGVKMSEISRTGIYEYEVTATSAWGTGDFTVECSESTKGSKDSMVLTVKGLYVAGAGVEESIDAVGEAVTKVYARQEAIRSLLGTTTDNQSASSIFGKVNGFNSKLDGMNLTTVSTDVKSARANAESAASEIKNITSTLSDLKTQGTALKDLSRQIEEMRANLSKASKNLGAVGTSSGGGETVVSGGTTIIGGQELAGVGLSAEDGKNLKTLLKGAKELKKSEPAGASKEDVKDLNNRIEELTALVKVLGQIVGNTNNKPIVEGWFEQE